MSDVASLRDGTARHAENSEAVCELEAIAPYSAWPAYFLSRTSTFNASGRLLRREVLDSLSVCCLLTWSRPI